MDQTQPQGGFNFIWPEVGVFMITAYGDNATETRARNLGAARYLTKPLDFAVLKDDLSRAIEGMV